MLDGICAYVTVRAWKMKEALKNFWEEERGDQIVSVILVLVVVVALALVFKDQITTMVGNMWSSINKNTGDFKVDDIKGKVKTTE